MAYEEKTHVYSSEGKSTLSVSGYGGTLSVSALTLDLAISTIPAAYVSVAPTDSTGVAPEVGIGSALDIYNSLADLASEQKECSVDLDMSSKDDADQSLSLSGWILSSVQVGPVTTTRALGITCVIRHPAFKLVGKTNYLTCSPTPLVADGEICDDVDSYLGALTKANELLAKSIDDAESEFDGSVDLTNGMTAESAFEAAKALCKSSIDPSDYLDWGGTGDEGASYSSLPCESAVSGDDAMLSGLKESLVLSHIPELGGSMFSRIIEVGCGMLGLWIIPTYDQGKLKIYPQTPWASSSASIPDSRITAITTPAFNENPVIGFLLNQSTMRHIITPEPAEEQREGEEVEAVSVYIPEGLKDKGTGRLIPLQIPDWINHMLSLAAGGRDMGVSPDPGGEKPSLNTETNQPDIWHDVISAYANSAFLTMYKADSIIKVHCPITLKLDGKTLVPGMTVGVKSGDSDLIHGCIQRIRHVYNCGSGTATTEIQLSHMRPPGGYDGVVPEPSANPLWSA